MFFFLLSTKITLKGTIKTSLTLHCTMWNLLILFFLNFFFKYFQFVYPNSLRKIWRILWCLINMQNFTIQKEILKPVTKMIAPLKTSLWIRKSLFNSNSTKGSIRNDWLAASLKSIAIDPPCPFHTVHTYLSKSWPPKVRSQNLI